jgi:CheY-like chemotaxis protein
MRVLVVEDEVDVGDVLRDYLLDLGHEPLVVRTAEAALGTLGHHQPHAIILDVSLPGMNGLDLLRSRPVRESGVPVVVVSGVATEHQARECLRYGAFDFVGKPVPFERLRDIIAHVEPHALYREQIAAGRGIERRRGPRAPVRIPVRVLEYTGAEWEGTSSSLSAFGVRVRTATPVKAGAAAKLSFLPPDGGPPLQVMSMLVRVYPDGCSFHFVNLTAVEFDRLGALVARLRER